MKKHWMNKLNKEERSHFAQFIKSKEGMMANLNIKDSRGWVCCVDCLHIAHKLGWYDELAEGEK